MLYSNQKVKEDDANDILGNNRSLPLFKDFRLIMSDLKGGERMMYALGFFVLMCLIWILED